MKARRGKVFVLGGRTGDIISQLGCFHAIHQRTGVKPIVFTTVEFGGVFDGCSYVDACPIQAHWWQGLADLEWEAIGQYGGATIVQPWHSPDWSYSNPAQPHHVFIHGRTVLVDLAVDPDAGSAMARQCGFTRAQWLTLPTVFDQRDAGREAKLVASHIRPARGRPVLLYQLKGASSPFGYEPEFYNALRTLARDFHLVDLSRIRSERIYDLLALYDAAAGLVTMDSATLHLAAASTVPLIALCADGWSGSTARGNCKLSATYTESIGKLGEAMAIIASWKTNPEESLRTQCAVSTD